MAVLSFKSHCLEAQDLFTFDESTACATHDMLACERCGGDGRQKTHVEQKEQVLEDLSVELQHCVVGGPETPNTWGREKGRTGIG